MSAAEQRASNPRSWDRTLRALVADAFAKRGDDEQLRAACARIVHAWELWPLVDLDERLEVARRRLDFERRQFERQRRVALDVLRATNHLFTGGATERR